MNSASSQFSHLSPETRVPLDTEPITERITISTRSWKLCLQFRQHSLGFPSIDMMSMWKIQSLSPFRILASRGSRWQGRRWQARWGWTACCRGRAQPSGQSSGTWELRSCTFEHEETWKWRTHFIHDTASTIMRQEVKVKVENST